MTHTTIINLIENSKNKVETLRILSENYEIIFDIEISNILKEILVDKNILSVMDIAILVTRDKDFFRKLIDKIKYLEIDSTTYYYLLEKDGIINL